MDYKQQILDYLSDEESDFDEGFALYSRFCKNISLSKYISRTRRLSKLRYELSKIAGQEIITQAKTIHHNKEILLTPTIKEESKIRASQKLQVMTSGKISYDDLTDEQKEYYQRATKYYNQMRAWHEKMKLVKTDNQRKVCITNIRALEVEKQKCWDTIDALLERASTEDCKAVLEAHNPKPTPVEDKDTTTKTTASDIANKISSAKTYITKNLKKLETLENEAYHTLKAKIKLRVELLSSEGITVKKHQTTLEKHGL